jgi:hypothetical protein
MWASERVMKSCYAAAVVSFSSGAGALDGYDNPQAALGLGPKDTGEFMGTFYYVTPFNAPYSPNDVVSIGKGGYITLQLANYALPLEQGPEIGVFTYQFFAQDNWPVGGTHDPVILFRPSQQAMVSVSEDGENWTTLNAGTAMTFDIPANAYQDVAATIEADYGMPFTGVLSDFDGKATVQDTIDVYDGSAGGTWFDISATGLEKVGYVRFSVAGYAVNSFELEALSIANEAIGMPVPEPSILAVILLGGLILSRKKSTSP